jgi:hypothetical protein
MKDRDHPARWCLTIGLFFCGMSVCGAGGAEEQDGPALPPANAPGAAPEQPAAHEGPAVPPRFPFLSLLHNLAREVVPDDFEERDGWGRQEMVFAGFDVSGRPPDLRISRRTKLVKHGVWRRFRVQFIHPERRLHLEIRNARFEPGSGVTCQVVCAARVRCTAQAVVWNYGVKGLSSSVQSDATVRVVADARITAEDGGEKQRLFSVVIFRPEVTGVKLRLADLDVRRVGQIGGDAADALGDASKRVVERLLERQEPKLRRSIAKKIDEEDLKLRLPVLQFSWPEMPQRIGGVTSAIGESDPGERQAEDP